MYNCDEEIENNTTSLDTGFLTSFANTLIAKIYSWPDSGPFVFGLGWVSEGGNYWVMKKKVIPITQTWKDG